jgi:hypothetical protein
MTNTEAIEILKHAFTEYKKDKENKLHKEERALETAIRILSEKEKAND